MIISLDAAEKEIVDEFANLPDVDAKYAHLFRLGEELPEMDSSLKHAGNLVQGCQSKLWFFLYQEDGRHYLLADSDSMVIKGIAALLARLVHGRTAEEVCAIRMDFIDEMQIWKLASNRNNGLVAMLEHIHKEVGSVSNQKIGK